MLGLIKHPFSDGLCAAPLVLQACYQLTGVGHEAPDGTNVCEVPE